MTSIHIDLPDIRFSLPQGDVGSIRYYRNILAAYSFDQFPPTSKVQAGYLRAPATDVDVVTHVGHRAAQWDRDAWSRMTRFAFRVQGAAPVTAEAVGIAGRATTLGN